MKITRDDLHVLSGSYVLDALSEPERDSFERHLRHCAPCGTEVRGLRETAARLGLAKSLDPPPQLRPRVLAVAYRIRQLPPPVGEQAGPERRRARVARLFAGRPRGTQRRALRWPWVPRLAAAFAAASLAVVVALGITQAVTRHQPGGARTASAAIGRVVTAPDARIQTTRTSVGGTVTVVVSAEQQAAVVSARGMPSLPSAETYQLWVIGPYGARSAGLLSGTGRAGPVLASGVLPGDKIGITVEPAGGTSSPTTTPVIAVPVALRGPCAPDACVPAWVRVPPAPSSGAGGPRALNARVRGQPSGASRHRQPPSPLSRPFPASSLAHQYDQHPQLSGGFGLPGSRAVLARRRAGQACRPGRPPGVAQAPGRRRPSCPGQVGGHRTLRVILDPLRDRRAGAVERFRCSRAPCPCRWSPG